MKCLLVVCGEPEPAIAREHGTFVDWFRRGSPSDVDWHVRDARAGDAAPHWLNDMDAMVITGSAHSVYDPLPWIAPLSALVRHAVIASRTPTLGVCFGHQLLAQALGGEVVKNPRGREIGTITIESHAAARSSRLLGGSPEAFLAQATHGDTVRRPPDGATVLARSSLDDCQAFEVGGAFGVQFHPEFAPEHLRALIATRRDVLRSEGLDPDAISRNLTDAPHASRLLHTFANVARRPPP